MYTYCIKYVINFVLYLIILCLIAENVKANCTIKINGDLPQKEPLYLFRNSTGYQFIQPDGPEIYTRKNQEITLACTGTGNKFRSKIIKPTNLISTRCSHDTKLAIAKENSCRNLPIQTFSCEKSITGDAEVTKENCGNGQGVWIKIGFRIRDRNIWIDLYRVCYNMKDASVIYTEHVLSKSPDKEKVSLRPSFKLEGTTPKVPVAKAYLVSEQLKVFEKLLGLKAQANKYIIPGKSFLARGHMSPDADFVFGAQQFGTYFYVNICPQWQVVNNGNWKRIEALVRSLSIDRKEDLLVYTGVYEILQLPGRRKKQVPLYISEDNKIAVPKWLWKIVFSSAKHEGIAFVTLNNPFVDKVEEREKICKDICREAGFNTLQKYFVDLKKGFSYCCKVDDLLSKVKIVPKFGIRKLLKNKKIQ